MSPLKGTGLILFITMEKQVIKINRLFFCSCICKVQPEHERRAALLSWPETPFQILRKNLLFIYLFIFPYTGKTP